ncbi:SusC/RagA family TonB-linked outer membrane protein [Arcticibacter tournemirensis]|uniref:SusC/RagA family TonB-linked outer membrane protein n=2 Tax=Arcticibacter tournemirensis TaxID=699437 RepID=A0A4Q0MG56_9SPHI|nr:SusC/RagA family TonB-linked outer membrane protein [Arcticibacter tournemirensis]
MLIIIFTVSVSAAGFSQNKINLEVKKSAISNVIRQIEGQTSYRFLYNENLEGIRNKVSVTLSDATIDAAMEELLRGTNLSYQALENQLIVIKDKKEALADIVITGKVVDVKGEELIGVSVKIKGTAKGVSTDAAGSFKLTASENAVLVFTYVGFETIEVPVQGRKTLKVTLKVSNSQLDEVVVIGYGTVKKKDLTGAVASVNAETIAAAPVSSALEAISGRVSGVQITTTEGSPDAEMLVRVRGGGSITGDNSPLYIVDGFPLNSISDIAPSDIESIDILKDASSTAIYGSRGANGVVVITTKSGSKAGKTTISYNAFTGFRNIAKKLDVLSPYDYALWQYERALLDNNSLDEFTDRLGTFQNIGQYKNTPSIDWQDEVFGRTGTTFNQNLNISGGGEKTKFSISHSYVKDKAIMLMSGFERHNLNFKLNHKLYDRLSIDVGARYANTKTEGGGANEQNEKSSADSRLKNAMIYPPFEIDGLTNSTETDPDFNLVNPLFSVSDNDQYVDRKTYNLNGALTYTVIDNLNLRSEVGYDGYRNDQDRFYGITTYYVKNSVGDAAKGLPAAIFTNTDRNTFRNTNTINYDFKKFLGKKHGLTALLGEEYIRTKEIVLTNTVNGYPDVFTFERARKLTTQGIERFVQNFYSPDDKLFSFFGRLNYDYAGKYLFSATFRADGSSKFAENNKWGYFPSFSGAWRVSDEGFMEGTKSWLSDLKLRASYGEAGNNRIPPGQIIQSLENSSTVWVNGTSNYWAPSKTMANPDLKWETTVTKNIGLDFSLFNTRVNGTVEAYVNNTKDLLILYPVSGSGYDNQYRNLGETRNKGLEFSLNWSAIRKKNFDLTLNANIAFNRNEVVSLEDLSFVTGNSGWASSDITKDYYVKAGAPVGQIYGYQGDGRYEVSDFKPYTTAWALNDGVVSASGVVGTIRPGSMKLKDTNLDGKISDADISAIGDANPLNTGGFSLISRLFNFDLGAYFNWSYGNDIYNANKIEYTQSSKFDSRNMLSTMEIGKRWTNLREDGTISNDAAELQAMNANTTMWSPFTSRFVLTDWAIEDGSFLRLSTLTLGYTLPASVSSKMKMKSLRIYASGYNLWLWTNYSGFDPEVSTRRKTPLTPGVDYSAYPKSRSFVFGLNVNF